MNGKATTPVQEGNTGSGRQMGDGFLKLEGLKLPDFADFLSDLTSEECEERYLTNCSCVAYSYASGIDRMVW